MSVVNACTVPQGSYLSIGLGCDREERAGILVNGTCSSSGYVRWEQRRGESYLLYLSNGGAALCEPVTPAVAGADGWPPLRMDRGKHSWARIGRYQGASRV